MKVLLTILMVSFKIFANDVEIQMRTECGEGSHLRIRSVDNTNSSDTIVGRIPCNQQVQVTHHGHSTNGWHHITYNGITGYSSSDFLNIIEETQQVADELVTLSEGPTSPEVCTNTNFTSPVLARGLRQWAELTNQDYIDMSEGWVNPPIDSQKLPNFLRSTEGCSDVADHRLMITKVQFHDESRSTIRSINRHGTRGNLNTDVDYNPASSVKLYSAIAASRTLQNLDVDLDERITFEGMRSSSNLAVDEIIATSLTTSSNSNYNYASLIGNATPYGREIFSEAYGISETRLRGVYARDDWTSRGGNTSLSRIPELRLTQDDGVVTIDQQRIDLPELDEDNQRFHGNAARTTIEDLNNTMLQLVYQQPITLPGFQLEEQYHRHLLSSLADGDHRRGEKMVDGLRNSLGLGEEVDIFWKGGASNGTYSDNLTWVDPNDPTVAWVVTGATEDVSSDFIKEQMSQCVGQAITNAGL